jgi:hypothetical protein
VAASYEADPLCEIRFSGPGGFPENGPQPDPLKRMAFIIR